MLDHIFNDRAGTKMSSPPGDSTLASISTIKIRVTLIGVFIVLIVMNTLRYDFTERPPYMKDYDVFHVSGTMVLDGRLAEAYRVETLNRAQIEILGRDEVMAFTYPPHYGFLAAGLSVMPLWLGYAMFSLVTFLAYVLALRQIEKQYYPAVLLMLVPAITVCLSNGQNGLLIGALTGAAALLILAKSRWAVLPLVLLTIKPHLAIGLGVFLLITKQWSLIVLASFLTAAVLGLSTLAFGLDIWTSYLHAISESARALELGVFPLYRMPSLYAGLQSLGLPSDISMLMQIGFSISVVVFLFWLGLKNSPERRLLGICSMASVLMSPYIYDYDLLVMGVGLSLLMADIAPRLKLNNLLLFMALAWIAGGALLVRAVLAFSTSTLAFMSGSSKVFSPMSGDVIPYAVGIWALCSLFFLILRSLGRPDIEQSGDIGLSSRNATR